MGCQPEQMAASVARWKPICCARFAALLRRGSAPEFIVIETSVVADPSDIVRNLMDPLIWREAPLENGAVRGGRDDNAGGVERCVAAVTAADGRRGGAEQGGPCGRGGAAQLREAVRALRPGAGWWSMRGMAKSPQRCCSPRTWTSCRRRAR